MNATNPLESSESDNIVFIDAEESEESFMNNSFFKKERKVLNDLEYLDIDDPESYPKREVHSLSIEEVISKCCPDISNSNKKDRESDLKKDHYGTQENEFKHISNSKLKTKEQNPNITNQNPKLASNHDNKKINNSNYHSHIYNNNKQIQYNTQPLYPNSSNYNYNYFNQMPFQAAPYINKASHFQPQFYQVSRMPVYPQPLPFNHINYQYGVVLSPANYRARPTNQSSQYSNSFSHPKKSKFPSLDSSQDEEIVNQSLNRPLEKLSSLSKTSKAKDSKIELPTHNQNQLTIKAILNRGNVAEYINSQKGSKRLQFLFENLEDNHPDIILLFDHITPFLGKISNHNFGNYFCQALLKKIPYQKRQIAWKFYGRRNLMDYASHQFGNHSIQSLVDAVNSLVEESFVIDQLEKHYDNLAFNINGCYILLRVMSQFQQESCRSLFNYINSNFHSVCCNGTATSIARKYVKMIASFAQLQQRTEFIATFSEKTLTQLFSDKHGSQVIILILNEWDHKTTRVIIDLIAQRIIHFMFGRFSRNVVSKCIQITENKVEIIYLLFRVNSRLAS